jgi:hypothetical protein
VDIKKILLIIILGLSLSACDKEDRKHPCYDSSIVHDNFCTADCPGFEGCDGKTYCNACEAARHGIGEKEI